MKISFVVPAFNEEKLILSALHALRASAVAFEARGWEWEIVVCDNNSTDRTGELARAEGARVVFEPLNQISRARNTGAAAATGDWLIFVDADSWPSRELVAEVAETIARGDALGGGALVAMDSGPRWSKLLVELWNTISRTLTWMAGSFIFCEAAAFRELDGFSRELFVSEEIEFSRRLKLLARARMKRVIVLRSHPLMTSGRKLHLYSPREYVRLLWRAVLTGGASYRDRDACIPWYDGRR